MQQFPKQSSMQSRTEIGSDTGSFGHGNRQHAVARQTKTATLIHSTSVDMVRPSRNRQIDPRAQRQTKHKSNPAVAHRNGQNSRPNNMRTLQPIG